MQYLIMATQHFNTNLIIYAQIPKEFNEINRIWIAYTEKEICAIIRIGVFCVDKTCFLRPGHIYKCIHYDVRNCACMYVCLQRSILVRTTEVYILIF